MPFTGGAFHTAPTGLGLTWLHSKMLHLSVLRTRGIAHVEWGRARQISSLKLWGAGPYARVCMYVWYACLHTRGCVQLVRAMGEAGAGWTEGPTHLEEAA